MFWKRLTVQGTGHFRLNLCLNADEQAIVTFKSIQDTEFSVKGELGAVESGLV